jgi:chromosome segregation ATPase
MSLSALLFGAVVLVIAAFAAGTVLSQTNEIIGRAVTTLFGKSKSSIGEQNQWSEYARLSVSRFDARLKEVEQRLASITDQLSMLKQMIEQLRDEGDRKIAGAIDARLAGIHKDMNVLTGRLDCAENGHGNLSTLTQSLNRLAQRVDEFELHLRSTLEARLSSTQPPVNSPTKDETVQRQHL